MSTKTNVGYGYIQCSHDDPKRTDRLGEDGKTWYPEDYCAILTQHCPLCAAAQWRKPVEIPEFLEINGEKVYGWELVPLNESPTEPGRSYQIKKAEYADGEWKEFGDFLKFPTVDAWITYDDSCAGTVAIIRRKQPAQPAKPATIDGWLDAKTIKPEMGQQVWVARDNGVVFLCNYFAGSVRNWTHWKPAGDEVPKAPEPVKSAAEKAWDAMGFMPTDPRAAFIAGYNSRS